jgi:branched-chain amino acid transport system ATP-binding protein
MSLIEVKALNSYYGDSHILFDVDMHVERNEVVALIGRNGAGKTTTLKSLMGIVRPSAGSVKFDGVELVGLPSHAIASICCSPPERSVPRLSRRSLRRGNIS